MKTFLNIFNRVIIIGCYVAMMVDIINKNTASATLFGVMILLLDKRDKQ